MILKPSDYILDVHGQKYLRNTSWALMVDLTRREHRLWIFQSYDG